MTRMLSNGRIGFWDTKTGTVVIVNPKAVYRGTVFKPKEKIDSFLYKLIMRPIQIKKGTVFLEISKEELGVLGNALNDVCN